MPRWSTGCERCRRRKVRCDETKPHCERCIKHGMVCPGYRDRPKPGERFAINTPSSMSKHDTSNHAADGTDVSRCFGSVALEKQRLEFVQSPRPVLKAGVQQQTEDLDSIYAIQTSPQMPMQLSISSLGRIQLLSGLASYHFNTAGERSMALISSQLSYSATVDHTMPLLRTAVDALCLAGVGSSQQDVSLLQESHAQYGRALSLLTAEVQRPSDQVERRKATLSSILLLAMCDRVDKLSDRGWAGWAAHLRGAQAYLHACGPDVIVSDFDWLLFHNIRLYSLFLGMAERRAVAFAEPRWLALTREQAKTNPWVAQQDLLALAPGLLERTDALLHKQSVRAVGDLVRDIQNLRVSMQVYQNKLHTNQPQYDLVDIADYPEFESCGSLVELEKVYRFRSSDMIPQNTLSWTCRLIMDCALLRLMHFRGTLNVEQFIMPLTKKKIEQDAVARAFDLCRCAPYSLEGGNMPESANWYLDTALKFFEEMHMAPEIAWCRSAIAFVQPKADAIGTSSFYGASRAISAATKFRAPEYNTTIQ